jgi:transposase-like protein
MDPQDRSCHNADCPARGQAGLGDIRIHSRTERRYRCTTCGRPFAETRDTPFYRLKRAQDLVTIVLTLPCHGCPIRAIVAAVGLDERTIAAWRDRAGRHGQHFHEHHALRGQVESGHVQADELSVRTVAGRLWMAMAMAVPSRLRPGGVVSPKRDLAPITAVVRRVRSAARSPAILACVDGPASYATASTRAFRAPVRTGRRGRPRLMATAGLLLGQVIKHRAGRCVVGVTRRVVRGSSAALAAVLQATGTGAGVNTAYIERPNAPCRGALSPLVRRGRAIARGAGTLTAGMYLVGCAYTFCWPRDGLRAAAGAGGGLRWRERTPAMAAGSTDPRWTMREWLSHPIPLPPWVPPKRRGRPPRRSQAAMA